MASGRDPSLWDGDVIRSRRSPHCGVQERDAGHDVIAYDLILKNDDWHQINAPEDEEYTGILVENSETNEVILDTTRLYNSTIRDIWMVSDNSYSRSTDRLEYVLDKFEQADVLQSDLTLSSCVVNGVTVEELLGALGEAHYLVKQHNRIESE